MLFVASIKFRFEFVILNDGKKKFFVAIAWNIQGLDEGE
jgi:hypothetical protein